MSGDVFRCHNILIVQLRQSAARIKCAEARDAAQLLNTPQCAGRPRSKGLLCRVRGVMAGKLGQDCESQRQVSSIFKQ